MAANDLLATALLPVPPAANAATLSFRAGGSTPNEAFPIWEFDASADEYLDLHGALSPRYTGAALKVRLPWIAASATSGNCIWNAAFRRLDTGEDLDASHSYSVQAVTTAAPGTNGAPAYSEIAFSAAQIDSLAAGEAFVLRISRDADNGSDTMTGDAQLLAHGVQVIET